MGNWDLNCSCSCGFPANRGLFIKTWLREKRKDSLRYVISDHSQKSVILVHYCHIMKWCWSEHQRALRCDCLYLGGQLWVLSQWLHHTAHVGSRQHVLHQLGVFRDLLQQTLHSRAVENSFNTQRNKKKLFMDLLLAGESINTCRKKDCCLLPLPRLLALTPRGLDTLGLVPAGVPVLPVVLPPLSGGLDEFGGPHGLGSGSRFSVRDGWAPDSEVPPRAENGLLPNYRNRYQTQLGIICGWSYSVKLGGGFFPVPVP